MIVELLGVFQAYALRKTFPKITELPMHKNPELRLLGRPTARASGGNIGLVCSTRHEDLLRPLRFDEVIVVVRQHQDLTPHGVRDCTSGLSPSV